ncbi:MAG: SDR family oxidoreductase, partial [Fuerstiella sp.]|nr:SDR family oxidoreductase [Fuerstiella sp.]
MPNTSEGQPVALITGSGRHRVGNVIARYLAERKYQIALHYHSSKEEAVETLDELRSVGVNCEAYRADVSSDDSVRQMVTQVNDRFGRIDVLATTASVWSSGSLDNITADDLRSNFDVNTLGTFFTARAVGAVMVEQPEGGSIVTFGDWAIERPYMHHAAYLLSKGTMPTLTRTLALELGHRNPKVRVNCIHPGPVMFPPD